MEVHETPQIKRSKHHQQESTKLSVPGAPRTRSQVAPDWTTRESLILVNEVAAVEGDCSKALSSYQKWKIIVGNCMAMDVRRTSNQCRRKWISLLAEYNTIKQWPCESGVNSYWSMQGGRRIELGLPENFDEELFKTINNYVKAQEDHLDTDPDTDPEAESDLLDVISEPGSKKQKRGLTPLKARAEEKLQKCCSTENPQMIHTEEESLKSCEEEKPLIFFKDNDPVIQVDEEAPKIGVEEKPSFVCESEKPQIPQENPEKIHLEEKLEKSGIEGKPISVRSWKNDKTPMIQVNVEPREIGVTEISSAVCESEKSQIPQQNPEKIHLEEKLEKSGIKGKPRSNRPRKKKISAEENKRMILEKLCNNAEMILSIVQEKPPETVDFQKGDLRIAEDLRSDFVRRQGDKLIAHLAEIVNILKPVPHPEA